MCDSGCFLAYICMTHRSTGEEKNNTTKSEDKVDSSEKKPAEDKPEPAEKKNGDEKQSSQADTKTEDDGEGKKTTQPATSDESSSAVEEHSREAVPSSILEKGIIYFFFRGRVNIESPSSVGDIQRSFMILRPIANDAKLGSGPIGDAGNSRLIAVPKKVFPTNGKERWLAFVEKVDVSFKTLREDFLSGEDYMTKTVGERHTPAAQPAAEGVYAITSTGRESHLAYMITLPSKLGELQGELGLKKEGSFVLSTRNPKSDAPRGTALPESAEYPQE